jgi:hypothetical protein
VCCSRLIADRTEKKGFVVAAMGPLGGMLNLARNPKDTDQTLLGRWFAMSRSKAVIGDFVRTKRFERDPLWRCSLSLSLSINRRRLEHKNMSYFPQNCVSLPSRT